MSVQAAENRSNQFENLDLVFEPQHQVVWARFRYAERPCMSQSLLRDVAAAQQLIVEQATREYHAGNSGRLKYQVLGSAMKGVFSLGGDLAHFVELIRRGDRDQLKVYATACVEVLYRSATSYGLPFTTISLVQGEALGGGFEAALSANLLIAEKQSRFGFPETVFGLFPGMGAFSFLARRLNPGLAKRLISSGKVHTAEELYDMGVVDLLVEEGEGEEAVYDYIQRQKTRSSGLYALDKVVEQYNPLKYEELIDVVDLWVDTALELSPKNLRLMEYLVAAQRRRWVDTTHLRSVVV
ncbi:MAG: enoyl-CoA hydratase/isomerase family protein [Gammaproteobacteria bacterium]|nr:enoyl-CoA hydratase/isomerase family protein [Gammaproteobacteria bacterium]